MKEIRNTDRVKRNIRDESMAAIRLIHICKSDIDLIEKFYLYLDICQIIEQDTDINSLNSVNIGFTTYSYYTVICYRSCIICVHNNGYLNIMGINKCNTISLDMMLIFSNVMCEQKRLQVGVTILR